jgi:HPr kinase/phosphorylase
MSNRDAGPSPANVKDFFLKARESLRLEAPLQEVGFLKKIKADASGRVFSNLQIWDSKETETIAALTSEDKKAWLTERFRKGVACVIFADGLGVPEEVVTAARRHKVAVFRSPLPRKQCVGGIRGALSDFFPNRIVVSGGLLQIFEMGVLIIGDSGVGKSESALELISRGHRFVSDDVTRIRKSVSCTLMGSAVSLSQNFMEIRGLSIINIEQIFGASAICRRSEIHLVISLERWEAGKEYDRLGLETPERFEILGVAIPQVTIPVAPGRNIATLIEVACKVHILRKKGYQAPLEIARRLDRALSSQ